MQRSAEALLPPTFHLKYMPSYPSENTNHNCYNQAYTQDVSFEGYFSTRALASNSLMTLVGTS
jgi:hypothetical protein